MKPISLRRVTLLSISFLCVLGVLGFRALIFERAAKESQQSQSTFTIEEWAATITMVRGDHVELLYGDRAGGLGSDNDAMTSIALLSPTLKEYPEATTFTVCWSYIMAMKTGNVELVYNRSKHTLTFNSHWPGSSPQVEQFPDVVDSMIHAAAANEDSYAHILNYKH